MKYTYTAAVLFIAIMVAFASAPAMGARGKQYEAMQVNIVIDGNLDEWGAAYPTLALDELKDTGAALPDPADFSGVTMVGWNDSDPDRIYLVFIVTDDILQDIHPFDDQWWNDDTTEIIFDFNNDGTNTKWAVGATGDLSAVADDTNTEFAIVVDGNQYTFEIAITVPAGFQTTEGGLIGLSPIYNDCENDVREHQLGWIAGGANDNANQGDLIFSAASSVEPSGKVATAWGALKR
jgi:hypothetical protein